ncbi:MAG: ABC transporter ATP-binding protein [Clostridiales bacterium]
MKKNKRIILELRDINAYYGNIHVLKDLNLIVYEGEIVSLIGSNGAGKSTTLKVISSLLKVKSGKIFYEDQCINALAAHDVAKKGLANVPEGRRIFNKMSVEENLELGAFNLKSKKKVKENIYKMYETFPILKERKDQKGGTLSGGEQQMLAIARALMSDPDILLLDEPSMGLAPLIVKQIFEIIKRLNDNGKTILLIEQNAQKSLRICSRAYIIQNGSIVTESIGEKLLNNSKVKEAYLGY